MSQAIETRDSMREHARDIIQEILSDAVDTIDEEFSEGYAMKNPHLVAVVSTLLSGVRRELG